MMTQVCSATKHRSVNLKNELRSLAMSKDQRESVAVSVESLLSDAVKMQSQCRDRSEQLAMAAALLREESVFLREQCQSTQLDMARMRRQLEELQDTKTQMEASDRMQRKLSKTL
ncbi:hypothetical protein UPYG_G00245920 [Umbra pygmaea]|uniref:Uncharacterized protein n=1 Tax=Umbra pygmaea TaxID=75934 RepID=A0ABD0X447_UMBPY